ncbi:MAG: hypothetical protein L3K03_04175 [Thermoplasmata archaeon]|nr:hypothetical protein [Thermoplasmata archaeon]
MSSPEVPSTPRPDDGITIYRIAIGIVLAIPLVFVLVIVPVEVLGLLPDHGVTIPISSMVVIVGGTALAAASAIRYIVRPSSWFGPAVIGRAAVAALYMYLLLPLAWVQIALPGSTTTVNLSYGFVIELLLVVPLLGALEGVLILYSDRVDPMVRRSIEARVGYRR